MKDVRREEEILGSHDSTAEKPIEINLLIAELVRCGRSYVSQVMFGGYELVDGSIFVAFKKSGFGWLLKNKRPSFLTPKIYASNRDRLERSLRPTG